MNMTLFADASLCPRTGAAGWGAWAKHSDWDAGRFAGDPFRRHMEHSTQAELCGIASAIWHFDRHYDAFTGLHWLIVQCDNIHALSTLRHIGATEAKRKGARDVRLVFPRAAKLKPIEKEALDAIQNIMGDTPIFLRHVRGHRYGDGRSWVNTKCDEEARRHMEAMRKTCAA